MIRHATLAVVCLTAAWPAPARAAEATRTVRLGPAVVTVPAAWRPVARHPATTTFATGSGERAVIAFGPPVDRTLVPAALRDRAGSGSPHPARLAGYAAWRYADVTVLPSAAGVLAVACHACDVATTRVSFVGAAVLAPAPDLAFRLRLPAVLARLDAARQAERRALRRALTPAGAGALAAAHLRAERALSPFAVAPQRPLLNALTDAAGAYRELAAAAGSGRRELAARRGVAHAEARLSTAVTGSVRADRFRVAPTPPTPPAGPGASGLLLALAAMLLTGAVLLLRRRGRPLELPAPCAPPRRHYPPPLRPAPPPPQRHEAASRWDVSG